MRPLHTFLLSLLLVIGSVSSLPAQVTHYEFENIRLGAGFDINGVNSMAQDQAGFLWVASWKGFFRYDGYAFKRYFTPGRPDTAEGGRLREVFGDRQGRIWLSTSTATLIYDASGDSLREVGPELAPGPFRHFSGLFVEDQEGSVWKRSMEGLEKMKLVNGEAESQVYRTAEGLPDSAVNCLLVDRKGQLWAGTPRGLARYEGREDRFVPLKGLGERPVLSLQQGPQGKLYLGTAGEGLWVFAPETGQWSHHAPRTGQKGALQGPEVRKICLDSLGQLWLLSSQIETNQMWLERYLPEADRFEPFLSPFLSIRIPFFTTQIQVDKQGLLWFVNGSGMYRFEPKSGNFEQIRGLESTGKMLDHLRFWYEDRQGLMWVSVLQHGLFRHLPIREQFTYLKHQPGENMSLVNDSLNSVYVDRSGAIWVASEDTTLGIQKIRLNAEREITFMKQYDWNGRICGEDSAGNLFVSQMHFNGLMLFDPVTEQELNRLRYDTIPGKGLSSPLVIEAMVGPGGDWWISTFGGGVSRYNPHTQGFRYYQYNPQKDSSIAMNVVGPMSYDAEGNFWLTTQNGLSRYLPETDNFENHLQGIITMSHYLAPDSTFWVITGNYGLLHFDPRTGESQSYNMAKSGIPTDRPMGAVLDDDGNFWLKSDVGLIFLQPEEPSFRLFDKTDGVRSIRFPWYHIRKLASGEVLIPTHDEGLMIFHPQDLTYSQEGPRLQWTDFQVLSEERSPRWEQAKRLQALSGQRGLRLNHDENVIKLSFAGMQLNAPEKQRYAYWLEGSQQGWVDYGNNREFALYGIRPGQYTLHAKAANYVGTWGPELQIPITVRSPWYLSGWAYLGYALALALIAWAIFNNLQRRWRLQAQLKAEEEEAERLKELDAAKNRFYTNISHEFRTPLTVIKGAAEEVKEKPQENLSTALPLIRRNADKLLRLVRQMLDLAKLESGHLPLRQVQGDVVPQLHYLLESFHSMAADKNLKLNFSADPEAILMDHDPEKLEQVVTNLISNAIKFSPREGEISLKVRKYGSGEVEEPLSNLPTSQLPNSPHLLLSLSDSGPGIAPEEQERVFERFYQGENGHSAWQGGTGVGLALSKELVELMGGEMGVASEKGKGSRFWLRLPIRREAPTVEQARPATVEKAEPLLSGANGHENGKLPLLLLVEDNEDVLRYLQMTLHSDYRLAFARNGQEGLAQARELIPDLILSDVMMPEMDGFELCEQVKGDWHTSHIPVILLTAKADQASRVSGLQHGADAYLAKPFDKAELLAELKKLRSLRQQLQQRYALPGFELPAASEPSPDDLFMEKIRHFLLSRMEDDTFKLDEVWTEMGMSRASLYRKFKALTGMTLADYLLSLRLHAASQLLKQRQDLSVSEVAFEVGFKSLSHFSRSYQKAFGHSPSEGRG